MNINGKEFKINKHNPEFSGMMRRIVKGIRDEDSAAIDAVRKDVKDAGLTFSISYSADSDRVQLRVPDRRPFLFDASEFEPIKAAAAPKEESAVNDPIEQIPDGEEAQPGDN